MSVYNGMPLLRDAVDSILAQTMQDFEFIVVNDGSTDGSLDYLQSVAESDPRMRILDQANTGLTRALVAGVDMARAPVIARMDADDLSGPDRLMLQLNVLDCHPELCAASCGIEYVDAHLSRIGTTQRQFDPDAWPLMMTLFNVIGGHGHMMFRRDAYEQVGGYDPHFKFAQDFDLWSRLLRHAPMGEAPGLLFQFRIGHESLSTRHGRHQRDLAIEIATREYGLLTATHPEAEAVGDSLDFWGKRIDPKLPVSRLVSLDRHLRQAFCAYEARHPDRRSAVRFARQDVARLWLQHWPFVPLRDWKRLSFFMKAIAHWDGRRLVPALGQRGLRQLVTLRHRLRA